MEIVQQFGDAIDVFFPDQPKHRARFTITGKDFLGSSDDLAHDFSAKVATDNSVEIVAERSMYFNYNNAWNGGHATMGFSY